jgi:hypothetical protein
MKQEVVNANIFAVRALAARKRNGGKIGILKFKKRSQFNQSDTKECDL